MDKKMSVVWGLLLLAGVTVAPATSYAEQKILSGDEIKTLITDKTVSVTHKQSGKQWKMHFSTDGKSTNDDGSTGTWEVNASGQHCNSGVKLKCAKVADLGDGTYARLKSNGDAAVIWTKIEDGKQL